VIEAELTQLASCSLWLVSPRGSPGRSRPDIATVADRPCTAVRQPRNQRRRSVSLRANPRARPEFERGLGSIPRGAEAVLRRPPGARRTHRRRGRPTRPQDASRSQRPALRPGSPSRPPLGTASVCWPGVCYHETHNAIEKIRLSFRDRKYTKSESYVKRTGTQVVDVPHEPRTGAPVHRAEQRRQTEGRRRDSWDHGAGGSEDRLGPRRGEFPRAATSRATQQLLDQPKRGDAARSPAGTSGRGTDQPPTGPRPSPVPLTRRMSCEGASVISSSSKGVASATTVSWPASQLNMRADSADGCQNEQPADVIVFSVTKPAESIRLTGSARLNFPLRF
jgi:hypothetical protein